MHLLIVSCTPRAKEKSNTDKILDEFKKGYEYNGNTTETLYLYKRNEWESFKGHKFRAQRKSTGDPTEGFPTACVLKDCQT